MTQSDDVPLVRLQFDPAKRMYYAEGDGMRSRVDATPIGLPVVVEMPLDTPFRSQRCYFLARAPNDANAYALGERMSSRMSESLYIQTLQFFRIPLEDFDRATKLPEKDWSVSGLL